ncbi:MAG TPA: hypothetical protein VGM81_13320 [Burkholderiaceae bacterium]|jgi:hypothetical protein
MNADSIVPEGASPTLSVYTNSGGDIRFTDGRELRAFIQETSERVSVMLELLGKVIEDGMLAVAIEGVTDWAYQVKQASDLLVTLEASEIGKPV